MPRGVGALLVAALGLAYACSSDEGGGGSGGVGGSDAGGQTFGQSACFSCLSQACASEQAACGSDPGCAAHLACSKACPVDASGYVAAACVAACPQGDTSSAQAARAALVACYQSGGGQGCAECGFAADAGSDSAVPSVLNQTCPASTLPDACDRCLAEKCCESNATLNQPGPIKDLSDCWLGCSDVACEQDCYAKYPSGISGFGGWEACIAVRCIGPGSCPTAGGPCGVCSYQNCGVELATCLTDPECYLARACSAGCGDATCVTNCRDSHPSATQIFDALTLCLQVKCSTEC